MTLPLKFPLLLKNHPNFIPHAGDMRLWEKVLSFNETDLTCSTQTHLYENNPLKVKGVLSSVNLIEYGAQAIAIHGGLLAHSQTESDTSADMGYIASIKKVTFFEEHLPARTEINVFAEQIMADDSAKLYQFKITDIANNCLCAGQVLVMHPE